MTEKGGRKGATAEIVREGKKKKRRRRKNGCSRVAGEGLRSFSREFFLEGNKKRKQGTTEDAKRRGEFSQGRLAGKEAFKYDYHSFTSLVNI